MLTLPKMYAPTYITFSTLRIGIGENLGVIFDMDTMVERKCIRVAIKDGWKWQLVNYLKDRDWDWGLEQDMEILDEYGSDLEFTY